MLANLALLWQNALTISAGALAGTTSVLTIVDGRIVYDHLADQPCAIDSGIHRVAPGGAAPRKKKRRRENAGVFFSS